MHISTAFNIYKLTVPCQMQYFMRYYRADDLSQMKYFCAALQQGHCVLNSVLRGHFLGIKMLQWNKSPGSFMSNFGTFSYFETSLALEVQQGLQKLPKCDINDLRLLFHRYILIPRKCPRKTPFKTQWGRGKRSIDPSAPQFRRPYHKWRLHAIHPLASQQ